MNDKTPETGGGEVAVYEDVGGEVRVDVRLDRETVWLTQRQMAKVFDSTPENVLIHLRNIFASGELGAEATTKEFLAVRTEGRRRVRRRLKHYNLDAIISVGYRVNTRRSVRFRQWATRTLHGHLVRGFALNERRLAERGLREARETLDLMARTLHNQALVDDPGQAVLDLIAGYADTWRLLLEYDEDRLSSAPGTGPSSGVLDHERAIDAIAEFRRDLMARNQASPLFGSPRGAALAAILGNIEQTMFGEPLYRSREQKAAHLLYFLGIIYLTDRKRVTILKFKEIRYGTSTRKIRPKWHDGHRVDAEVPHRRSSPGMVRGTDLAEWPSLPALRFRKNHREPLRERKSPLSVPVMQSALFSAHRNRHGKIENQPAEMGNRDLSSHDFAQGRVFDEAAPGHRRHPEDRLVHAPAHP